MRYRLSVILIISAVLFQSCKSDDPLYNPSIKAISFSGIAPEDVELNQTERTITIAMTAIVNDFKLKPSLVLTPHTEIADGLLPDGTLDLSDYCPCNDVSITPKGRLVRTITLRNTADNGTGTYLVLLETKNPLVIKNSSASIEISFDKPTRIFLPAENYYGSRGVYGISLAETGSGTYSFMSADGGCMSICDKSGQHTNQVGFSLDAYKPAGLKPGNYDLRIRFSDGNVLRYPQPIVIK